MSFARVLRLKNDMTDSWLPDGGRPDYEQRRLVIEPGGEYVSSAAEWADALVLLKHGSLQVECLAGARRTFEAEAILCLEWLPLRALRSTSAELAVLVAV